MIQSIERAFDIMELFLNERSLRAVDISKKTGLHISTTRNILLTLERRGYLNRMGTNRYSLGYQNRLLGNKCELWDDLKNVAAIHMEKLAETSGNNIFLGSELDGKLFCIAQCSGSGAIVTSKNQGWMKQLHCTATGKIILAFSDEKLLSYLSQKKLERVTEKTIDSWDELKRICSEIKKKHWALSSDESVMGISSLAVGIFNGNRQIVAALGEAFPTYFIKNGEIDIMQEVNELKKAAQHISASYNNTNI